MKLELKTYSNSKCVVDVEVEKKTASHWLVYLKEPECIFQQKNKEGQLTGLFSQYVPHSVGSFSANCESYSENESIMIPVTSILNIKQCNGEL